MTPPDGGDDAVADGLVDAHHHLWDPAARPYPWMAAEALAPLRRRYDLDDLRAVTSATGVTRTVVVQAVGDVDETRALLAAAAASGGLVAGVVGWVDLTAPDVGDVLGVLRDGPGGAALVGIRHQVQDEPDAAWLDRDDVRRGLRAVAEAGLAYDLLVQEPQLPAAVRCVAALPEVRFVLDHGAKPPIASGRRQPWERLVRDVAGAGDVACKLSGLVTEASWGTWTRAEVLGYAEVLLDAFGAPRLMAGSDWPVCELAATYAEVWALAHAACGSLDDDERTLVLGGTAVEVYGL